MASLRSFRRKPEPRDVSLSATSAPMGKARLDSGLRRNDEGEKADRFPHYFILRRKD